MSIDNINTLINNFNFYNEKVKQALEKDNEKIELSSSSLQNLIQKYNNDKRKINKLVHNLSPNKEIEIITNGNAYSLIEICLLCIEYSIKAKISTNLNLVNTSKTIIQIFNNTYFSSNLKYNEKSAIISNVSKMSNSIPVIIIDDSSMYKKCIINGINAHYISFNSIDILYDDSDFEETIEVLETYAEANYIEYHTYKIKKIYDIKLISAKETKPDTVVILTKDADKYKNLTSYSNKYINQNPFRISN